MKEILEQVKAYIDQKNSNRTWVAGKDFVNYAGAHYDSSEYMAGVESLLKGWLAMGNDGLTFERKFPPEFGKTRGRFTNPACSFP
jgi:hypothetical protein